MSLPDNRGADGLRPPGHFVRRGLHFLGVDRAIAYVIVGRAWAILAGPLSLFFIARHLSVGEQGFYYTFNSVLGLQIFFDLGVSFVLLQRSSHESARLRWTAEGLLAGDDASTIRIASLLRKGLGWYAVVAVLVITIIAPLGMQFFARNASAVDSWRAAWTFLVVASAANLLISPIFSVLEGCGLVPQIALLRLTQGIASNLVLWLALSSGLALMALPLMSAATLVAGIGWLVATKRQFLKHMFFSISQRSTAAVNWWTEIWPFQWRIAVSWLSGYFIFQLFNPILFVYRGAEAAGRMGMSITIISSISVTAIAWLTTKAPAFGRLVAVRGFQELDAIFFRTLWQSLAAIIAAGGSFWVVTFYLWSSGHRLSERLLEPLPLAFLVGTYVLNQVIVAQAVYLRAHLQEPFLGISVVTAILMAVSTYVLGKRFGATGMTAGGFVITLAVGLGGGSWVFNQKRREWHR
ncbi:MAG TPA: hypothetical protein VNM92_15360 [Thermoanaerobaculia bacterium]|nr:hypothetical protein [Thermoanaerobaculia bacterium]